jgi:uncharacterized membrane protein YeaQ/YmgE (transglycosylase-associated protein family)
MEAVLEALGIAVLVLLVGIGLLAGWIAGAVAGRQRAMYLVLGVLAAVAVPLVLMALGVGLLAAGGVLAVLAVSAIGAILLLVIVKLATR